MKNLLYIFLAIGLLWACSDEAADNPRAEVISAPTLSSNDLSAGLALNQDQAEETVLMLSWEPADFGTSNAPVTYGIEFDTPEGSFEDPVRVASTTENAISIQTSVLNNAALNKDIAPNEAAEVAIRVVAMLGIGNTALNAPSNVINFQLIPYADIPTFMSDIGIIGSATPGGWDADTDMENLGDGVYRITMDLIDGEAKFRQDDDWAVNWGATDFPVGTGEQDGPNIPITAGTYQITFNKNTAAYEFVPTVGGPSIGLIGSATPGGWDEDTDMFTADGVNYTLEIDLVEGEAKFRQDDDWAVNWGATDFPSGVGEMGGPNIPIAEEGTYIVSFNIETAAYNFERQADEIFVGIIGDATPGGWDEDTDMEEVEPGVFQITLDLLDGAAKFRANDDWELNWGGTEFPSGEAVVGGDNIPVTAGSYRVTLDLNNLTYNFEEQLISTLGIIGSATPGGWDADTDMQDNGDGTYSIILGLLDGEVKFRTNDDWAVNWGSLDFPSGVGIMGGENIPVTAGLYLITFNTSTAEYSFEEATIGLIGSATPGGWDEDTNMAFDPATPNELSLTVDLVDGEAKFRANDDWEYNWGAEDFPAGVGVQDGPNIPITAGSYVVTFNVLTGDYNFAEN